MSILRALTDQYERLAGNGDAPEYGYSRESVSFAMVLGLDGSLQGVADIRDTSGRLPRPGRCAVPRPAVRSGTAVRSNFLWDKTGYALGFARDKNTGEPAPESRGQYDAFKALHSELLLGTHDEGLFALLRFLESWRPDDYESLSRVKEMVDRNVLFRLDGESGYLHERPAAKRIWAEHLETQGHSTGICLVTGRPGPTQRLHARVKGVRNAQSSGASIVSFNLDAFESYGRRQGDNAQVSERAAFAYTSALNAMLARDSGRNIRIGDTTTVFWAHAADGEQAAEGAEELFAIVMDPPSTDAGESVALSDTLEKVSQGRALADVRPDLREDTRFFVLGLAPNAARISVRFWHEDTIGAFVGRIAEHWQDLRIEPWPWNGPPAVWSLLMETVPHRKAGEGVNGQGAGDADRIPPLLGGQVMRAILTGSRYPRTLLATVVSRMRAEKDINGRRVAICKACLARDRRMRHEVEDIPMSLDTEDPNPAYRLGRLFALYESLQRAAQGTLNATIKDRYFGAASAAPASIFPLLERNSANHLASLRKGDRGGLAHWFDREIDGVIGGIESTFPRSLRLEEQGRFAIGYHHQRTRRAADASAGAADVNTNDQD